MCHGEEIPFVFNVFQSLSDANNEDEEVANTMSTQWVDFIQNENEEHVWPWYTNNKKQWLEITDELSILDNFKAKQLRLWDDIGYDRWPNKV